jgi:D-inositol-3-phosphate glycosyltransferase
MKNQVAQTALWGETDERVRIEGRLLRESDMIIAATPLDRAQMQFHYNVDGSGVAVVPCGVDTTTFRPYEQAEARRRVGLPATPSKIVLFVGRIEPLKGLDTLLRAMAVLQAEQTTNHKAMPRLVVVGGDAHAGEDQWGSEERRLRQMVSELGLDDVVQFIGSRPQAQLPLLYSAADVVAVPSHYESFGLVALEAQACGTPVVASKVGGLNYTVQDGVSGFLEPWDDPNAFAQRIRQLVEHEGLREEMGANAIANAQSYTWPRITDRMVDLYETVQHRWKPALNIVPLRVPRCAL